MLLADTMAIFFVILGLLIAFPALWLLCRGLWPRMLEDVKGDCKSGLLLPFFCGLPIMLVSIFTAIAIGGKKFGSIGDLTSLGILCVFFVYANAGICGLATFIGERLVSPADRDRPWQSTIRGGIVLELSFLLPFVGWFLIWPVSLSIGCGAITRALMKRSRKAGSVSSLGSPSDSQGTRHETQSA